MLWLLFLPWRVAPIIIIRSGEMGACPKLGLGRPKGLRGRTCGCLMFVPLLLLAAGSASASAPVQTFEVVEGSPPGTFVGRIGDVGSGGTKQVINL